MLQLRRPDRITGHQVSDWEAGRGRAGVADFAGVVRNLPMEVLDLL